jgi:hypothetical protein
MFPNNIYGSHTWEESSLERIWTALGKLTSSLIIITIAYLIIK